MRRSAARSTACLAAGLAGLTAVACGGSGGSGGGGQTTQPSPTLPSSLVFTQPPLDPSVVTQVVPLGNLNPPAHTLPTNHIYFFHQSVGIAVLAPAGGVVQVATRGADDSLLVEAATGTSYNVAHLTLDAGIAAGTSIASGQRLGVTSSLSMALDLGVTNLAVTLFFVKPERYIPATIHADSPLKYFQEPTKSALYAKVLRNAPDKDGRIDFDRAGRLAGNWFLDGLPAANTENVANGPKHLAFVRDVADPSVIRISIGGSLSMTGAFYVADGSMDPADVSPSTGPVSYRLYTDPPRSSAGVGQLLVQMLADDRIQIEAFPGPATSASFTPAALIYVR